MVQMGMCRRMDGIKGGGCNVLPVFDVVVFKNEQVLRSGKLSAASAIVPDYLYHGCKNGHRKC